jgi:hypothetical protein
LSFHVFEFESAKSMTEMNRRSFMKIGSLSLGGLTLPSFLRLRQAGAASRANDTSVILLWMAGGPSHIDTYDLKPDAPSEVRGPFQPIETSLPGLQVCDLMPRHAAIADKLAVIRSFHHKYGVHDDAQHLVQTGYPQLNARQNGQRHPCQGSVASQLRGSTDRQMPSYVCIPEDYRSHAGFYQAASFLSARHNALNSGGIPDLGNYRPPEFVLPAEVSAGRFEDRRQLLRSLDEMKRNLDASTAINDLDDVHQQALELVTGSKAREAFDLSAEPARLKDKYGKHAWGQYALLARRLVEAGVTFVTINLYEKDVDWWDDHYEIEKKLRARLPIYDQMMSALIEDLNDRGLSRRVLVVACGEFGRAPRIDANAGRGHWPRAMHAVLSGGGIRPGQIIGSTTKDGGDANDRPLTPGDLLASIYQALGINPRATVTDRQNRPIQVVEQGEPIRELFA